MSGCLTVSTQTICQIASKLACVLVTPQVLHSVPLVHCTISSTALLRTKQGRCHSAFSTHTVVEDRIASVLE